MSFKVSTEVGSVSAHVHPGAYMDAAVTNSGQMAGLELGVDRFSANDIARPSDRAPAVVTFSMHPDTMRAMVYLLAQKTGLPLLTAVEWQTIVDVLRTSNARACHELADKIERGPE